MPYDVQKLKMSLAENIGEKNAAQLVMLLAERHSLSEISKKMPKVFPTKGSIASVNYRYAVELKTLVTAYLVQHAPVPARGNSKPFVQKKRKTMQKRVKKRKLIPGRLQKALKAAAKKASVPPKPKPVRPKVVAQPKPVSTPPPVRASKEVEQKPREDEDPRDLVIANSLYDWHHGRKWNPHPYVNAAIAVNKTRATGLDSTVDATAVQQRVSSKGNVKEFLLKHLKVDPPPPPILAAEIEKRVKVFA